MYMVLPRFPENAADSTNHSLINSLVKTSEFRGTNLSERHYGTCLIDVIDFQGVTGRVFDEFKHPLVGASVTVSNRETHSILTSKVGEYWRLLLPGTYELVVSSVTH